MKFFHYGIGLFLLSTACMRSNPAAASSPDILQPSSPVTSPVSRSWTLVPDESLHSYASRVLTTVELQEEAGVVRDSFSVTVEFSMRLQRNGELPRVTGTLDRLQRSPENRDPQTEPPAVLPLAFAGHITSGGLTLDSVAGRAIATVTDCENPGLNQMGVIQRNISIAPLTLRPGTAWTDSSTVKACSGTIPVELTSVRVYTVAGDAQGAPGGAIVVERSERIRATGEGTQGQHRIGLQATGSGSARLLLEPASGLLRLAEGESRTAIVIRSSGRQQQFVQTVRERTTRVR